MYLKTVLLTIIIVHSEAVSFKDSLKNIKTKANQFYKTKYSKNKFWHYLWHDPTEYPGTNEKYFKINKQKWDIYYECLDIENKNLGRQLSITPEAILAFEGSNIKFECRICISPWEQDKSDALSWSWAADIDKHLEPIQFTEYINESPEDKTLHLYNLQMKNTGQYICSLGESLTAPYFLTVTNLYNNERIEVHPHDTPLGPYFKEAELLQDYNLVVDTVWGRWSSCSKCDDTGKRHKLGYCIIYLKDYYKRISSNVNNVSKYVIKGKQKHMLIKDSDLELFDIFRYGIPCNSHILPNSIKEHPPVKNRKNEIMTGYCQVNCLKNKLYRVKDRNGYTIEEANNSGGIYSLLQSLPILEPPIERRLEYGIKGKTIILSCPGNMNSDSPLQWQVGNKNLIPEIISTESDGRIFISITDKVHINNARLSDSNIYSCWQQARLVGTIRLIIEKKIQMNFSHHLMLLGIIIVLSTFVYVFTKAFVGRKYAKI